MAGEIRYADSNGVSIAYRVLGDGPLELVFVTGFVGHLEVAFEYPAARRFFDRLASFSRLVVYDKRGQGLSDRPDHAPTLEESMDDLRAVIEAAGLTRPAIFGISEGGPMAILFAASQPERVSSLVLYGTYARIMRAPDYEFGFDPEDVDGILDLMREDWGGPVGLHLWAPSVADDEGFRDWWARFLRSGTSPRGATELISLYQEIDVRHALPAIETPTLVLHK